MAPRIWAIGVSLFRINGRLSGQRKCPRRLFRRSVTEIGVNGAEILGHWGGVIVYHWRDD